MVQKDLIYACQQGQRKAQKELYERFSSKLFGCCVKYAPNYEEAKDILQDSFITIYHKIDQYEGKGSLEGWMKRIAVNTALQRYRGKKVYQLDAEEQIEDESMEIDDSAGVDLDLEQLLAMVQQLPDRYRMVFSLYVLDGYSHQEIADMMEISSGTSKSNLARARKHLQTKINEWRELHNTNAS